MLWQLHFHLESLKMDWNSFWIWVKQSVEMSLGRDRTLSLIPLSWSNPPTRLRTVVSRLNLPEMTRWSVMFNNWSLASGLMQSSRAAAIDLLQKNRLLLLLLQLLFLDKRLQHKVLLFQQQQQQRSQLQPQSLLELQRHLMVRGNSSSKKTTVKEWPRHRVRERKGVVMGLEFFFRRRNQLN